MTAQTSSVIAVTVEQALRDCRNRLKSAQIDDPAYEAGCLVQKVLECNRTGIISHGNENISTDKLTLLIRLTERRIQHEPLQYILESWSFCGFDFCVGEGVLIPRDDTEVVVNLCRDFLKNRQSKRAVDLCAGSGAISVALDKLANADVTAVELSEQAFGYLQKNIKLNNSSVKVVKGDVFRCYTEFADESFDLVVSNPPYIKSDEIAALQPEVQREPKMALDGGSDGYDFYKTIIKHFSSKLKKGGAMAFELGENQADFVADLLKQQGFKDIKTALDLSDVKRAIIGTL